MATSTTSFATTPVGQLVRQRPGRAVVLERYGIDYCCQGGTTLAEQCQTTDTDVETLCQELAEHDAVDRDEMHRIDHLSLTDMIHHIVTVHHAYLRQALPRLHQLLAKVAMRHSDRHPELRAVRELFAGMADELEAHMFKEERILFPAIEQLERGGAPGGCCGSSIQNPIRMMEFEHQEAGDALGQIRRLTSDYKLPDDACTSYQVVFDALVELEKDLHMHIHEENNVLFPLAIARESGETGPNG